MAVPRFQIENINLIKRIFRLSFALKNQRLAVRGKITFAAAAAFESELAEIRKEPRFAVGMQVGRLAEHTCGQPPEGVTAFNLQKGRLHNVSQLSHKVISNAGKFLGGWITRRYTLSHQQFQPQLLLK